MANETLTQPATKVPSPKADRPRKRSARFWLLVAAIVLACLFVPVVLVIAVGAFWFLTPGFPTQQELVVESAGAGNAPSDQPSKVPSPPAKAATVRESTV